MPNKLATCALAGLLGALATGCGALGKKTGGGPAADPAADEAASGDASLDSLVAQGPNGLALKILAAFGRSMTTYTNAAGTSADYLEMNAALFTGAVSPQPYTTIPSKLASVSYFMAVAGLSQVVANNYAAKLAGGAQAAVANSCTDPAGAAEIIRVTYPPVGDADLASLAQLLVQGCTQDGVAPTIRALILSYPFVLKTGA